MSRIEESLYRISGARLNESKITTTVFKDLIPKLQSKFGDNFNEEPICSEVCEYLYNEYPQVCPYTECSVFIKDGPDFIPVSSSHNVTVTRDFGVLDFTNQQYNNYEEYGNNTDCPRVFKHVKDNIYANGNMVLVLK